MNIGEILKNLWNDSGYNLFGIGDGWKSVLMIVIALFFLYLVLFVLGALLSIGLLLAVETAKAEDSTRKLEHFSLCVGSLFTVVSNTALVLPMLTLVSYISDTYKSLSAFYATLTVVNFLPELLITVVVAPMVIFGMRRGLHLDVSGASKKTTRKVVQSDGEI